MVNGLTLSKIIKLNTGIKDIPDNVFFASKVCKGTINHKCVRYESYDANSIHEHLKAEEHPKLARKPSPMQKPDRRYHGKSNTFKTVSIVFGVIILLNFAVLGVILFRRRSAQRPKRTDRKYGYGCNKDTTAKSSRDLKAFRRCFSIKSVLYS